ncbi:MAG: helix-turn-helix domain-containing protein [Christensenellales bacterium]|jgi:transcriptional regulator with XRE-family HTH domain
MSRLGDQLRDMRAKKGLTLKQVAKKGGVSEKYLDEVERGNRIVNDATAQRLLKAMGMGEDMISDLEVPAEALKAPEPAPARPQPAPQAPPAAPAPAGDLWQQALSGMAQQVPVLDGDGAPQGYERLLCPGGKIAGYAAEKVFYQLAADDSMAALRIHRGDRVLIVPERKAERGVYLILYQGQRMLRQLDSKNGAWRLVSGRETPAGAPVQLGAVKILGKAVKVEFDLK